MKELTLEKYLNDKYKLNLLMKNTEKISSLDELIHLVNNISELLPNLKEYMNFHGYINLTETTVDIIKDLKSKRLHDFKSSVIKIYEYLDELLADLTREIQVDIYYYGKNTHNLINKKFLKANVYKLENFYEVNYIERSISKNKHFTVLLLEESVSFSQDFDIEDKFDEVFDYTKIIKNLFDVSNSVYKCDYDFNYLRNELEASTNKDVKAIIVGNGYATSGIDKSLLTFKTTNLALPSQDLHYSFEIAKKAIEKNPSINKCLIGIGYYSMYHNLKKSKHKESLRILDEIYKPIVEDDYSNKQDPMSLEDYITNPIILELFNLKELSIYFNSINHTINSNYFNSGWARENNTILKGYNFETLHSDDKFSAGIWRAAQHNKAINEFSRSNEKVLIEFFDYLESKNVLPILIVLPTTPYYNRFIDKLYEKSFNDTINKLNETYNFKLINFNHNFELLDSDFIDVDHLNEIGCIKLTSYLNNLLKWLKTSKE